MQIQRGDTLVGLDRPYLHQPITATMVCITQLCIKIVHNIESELCVIWDRFNEKGPNAGFFFQEFNFILFYTL